LTLRFETLNEGRIGVTLPHQKTERRRCLLAAGKTREHRDDD
jgi:hypothetical protein